ncbi:hypothetical protein ACNKHQ_19235 [Shigella flexneri]
MGNGISIIIFAGIVTGTPPAIAHLSSKHVKATCTFLLLLLVTVLVFS